MRLPSDPEILIIGAGPMGLGAAWRLHELGHSHWRVVEASSGPGGASASVTDAQGFTWDLGGPIPASPPAYFNQCVHTLLGDSVTVQEESAWGWMRGRFIAHPVQKHLRDLPEEEHDFLLGDLHGVSEISQSFLSAKTLLERRQCCFGERLTEEFWIPYDTKKWARPPSQLNAVGIRPEDTLLETSGSRPVYRAHSGGAGALWQAMTRRLPAARFLWNRTMVSINAAKRTVTLADRSELKFDGLISSMPLNHLVCSIQDMPELASYAGRFVVTGTHLVGIGLKGELPPWFAGRTRIDLPEERVPAFRLTVHSGRSPGYVPAANPAWSLLCEVSVLPRHPGEAERLTGEVLKCLRREGLIPASARIASLWHTWREYGQPTPFYGRDAVLEAVQPRLKQLGIFSRGRFGGWRYEVSGPDQAFLQGKEAVDALLLNGEEPIYLGGGTPRATGQTGISLTT